MEAGSVTELYVSAGLCLPLGLLFLVMAIMNLVGEHLGSPGRRFIFEMDEVMGGLLGIPHYSKLEFILLALTSAGLFLAWARDPALGLVTVLGLLTGSLYMLVCLLYGFFARQNLMAFAVPGLATLAMLLWRAVRFLAPPYRLGVGVCGGVGALLCLAACMVMRRRRERCQPAIEKLLQIQQYELELKARKEKLVWLAGKDAPEGFEAKAASSVST